MSYFDLRAYVPYLTFFCLFVCLFDLGFRLFGRIVYLNRSSHVWKLTKSWHFKTTYLLTWSCKRSPNYFKGLTILLNCKQQPSFWEVRYNLAGTHPAPAHYYWWVTQISLPSDLIAALPRLHEVEIKGKIKFTCACVRFGNTYQMLPSMGSKQFCSRISIHVRIYEKPLNFLF